MKTIKERVQSKFITFLMLNLIIISSFLFSSFTQARTPEDVMKDLKKAARSSVATYKKGGMSGLISVTQDCYKRVGKNKFYCVYLDLASRRIDQLMVEGAAMRGIKFPKNEFFDDEEFGPRVAGVFNKANMSMDDANEYLAKVTPIINKLVEENLMNK